MAKEPFLPGTICKINGTEKKIRILQELIFNIVPKGSEPATVTGHIYEVEHLTEKKLGDKSNYPGDQLTPITDSNEIHLAGIHQALDWVLEVLNGTTNTWLLPKEKCEKIKAKIADLQKKN